MAVVTAAERMRRLAPEHRQENVSLDESRLPLRLDAAARRKGA